jgi:hypothetical protein
MTHKDSDFGGATLVHVYGTDRSGSTMLDLILGNGPDAFSCGEVSSWFRPYRKHHFRIDCLCGQDPCPVWEKIKDVPERLFHAVVAKELKVNFVIDSSKDICWLIDAHTWASSQGLRTANLIIWKDPVDLAYSYWKRGKPIEASRRAFVKCHGWVLRLGLPFLSIHYDDLVSDPSRSVERLCRALGMSYFEGKARFWEQRPHHLFGSGGIRHQAEAKDSRIEKSKTYPAEFEQKKSSIEKRLAGDRNVQRIILALRSADVLRRDDLSIPETDFVPPRWLPFWYYRKALLKSIRRYFPERYDDSGGGDAETIPLKRSP